MSAIDFYCCLRSNQVSTIWLKLHALPRKDLKCQQSQSKMKTFSHNWVVSMLCPNLIPISTRICLMTSHLSILIEVCPSQQQFNQVSQNLQHLKLNLLPGPELANNQQSMPCLSTAIANGGYGPREARTKMKIYCHLMALLFTVWSASQKCLQL